jgi:hypothetical protein
MMQAGADNKHALYIVQNGSPVKGGVSETEW